MAGGLGGTGIHTIGSLGGTATSALKGLGGSATSVLSGAPESATTAIGSGIGSAVGSLKSLGKIVALRAPTGASGENIEQKLRELDDLAEELRKQQKAMANLQSSMGDTHAKTQQIGNELRSLLAYRDIAAVSVQ